MTKKLYICHSGGYDSTLCFKFLCDDALNAECNLELFPIYLSYLARPAEAEIHHSRKSIEYFREQYSQTFTNSGLSLEIHDLEIFELNNTAIIPKSFDEENRLIYNYYFYSNFLSQIAFCFNRVEVNDVVFGFHKGDHILSALNELEQVLNGLRGLSYGYINSSRIFSQPFLLSDTNLNLRFHYPLKNYDKEVILNECRKANFFENNLCFSCEGDQQDIKYNEKLDAYTSPNCKCNKCRDFKWAYMMMEENEEFKED